MNKVFFHETSVLAAIEKAFASRDEQFFKHLAENLDFYLNNKKVAEHFNILYFRYRQASDADFLLYFEKISSFISNKKHISDSSLKETLVKLKKMPYKKAKNILTRVVWNNPSQFISSFEENREALISNTVLLYPMLTLLSKHDYLKNKNKSLLKVLLLLLDLDFSKKYRCRKWRKIFRNLMDRKNIQALKRVLENGLLAKQPYRFFTFYLDQLIVKFPFLFKVIADSKRLSVYKKTYRKEIKFRIFNLLSSKYRCLIIEK